MDTYTGKAYKRVLWWMNTVNCIGPVTFSNAQIREIILGEYEIYAFEFVLLTSGVNKMVNVAVWVIG